MRAAFVFAFSAMAAVGDTATPPDAEEEAYPAIERFVEVLEAVRTRHPDVDRVAYDRLVNHALEGMLASLDPFSSFIHPEMAAMGEMDAEVPSLGLTLGLRDDGPYLASVAPSGAAAEAKLLAGSAVLEIDGRMTEGVDFKELLESLRRRAGETSRLTVKQMTEPKPVEVAVVHRWIEQRSVAVVKMVDEASKTGYVRLAQFGSGCAREMEASLDELEDGGMKSLVLDLRGNGGGDLHETVAILGLFLPPGTEVVRTKGREAKEEPPLKTPERQRRKRDYPVTVLIDRMSASASELTAGALQDLKRAKIMGEVSYGKGSVQNIIPMGGGTALRLTIATYHTPSGRTPHRVGITPDVAVETSDEDRRNFEAMGRIDSLAPDERRAVEAWKDRVLEEAIRQSGK